MPTQHSPASVFGFVLGNLYRIGVVTWASVATDGLLSLLLAALAALFFAGLCVQAAKR